MMILLYLARPYQLVRVDKSNLNNIFEAELGLLSLFHGFITKIDQLYHFVHTSDEFEQKKIQHTARKAVFLEIFFSRLF